MQLPINLRDAIEAEAGAYGLAELKAAARRFSDEYRAEAVDGGRVITGGVQAAAYAAARMPATWCAVSRALSLIGGDMSEYATMLDVGSGTGAALWAARGRSFAGSAICIERERDMAALGQCLLERTDAPEADWISADINEYTPEGRYDLVTAAYCLNELSDDKRIEAALKLYAHTARMLIIIEPGTPLSYQRLMRLRGALIERGAFVLAPCPHGGACPLPDGDWCHFTARVERTRLHKALKDGDAPYEDEKFAFLAVSPEHGEPACAARVLRHPIIESGRITLRLCSPDGVVDRVVSRRDKAAFRAARKAESGDAIYV